MVVPNVTSISRTSKKSLVSICLIILLMLCFPVFAADTIVYNFNEEIEVISAAEFTAYPGSTEISGWVLELAGGTENPIDVLYGTVALKTLDSESTFTEDFIKISGTHGAERFLVNSMSTRWYDEDYRALKQMKLFFWSAKKLEGNAIVKYFNPPIRSVVLEKNYDRDGRLILVRVFFSNDGNAAHEAFWSDEEPKENVYTADIDAILSYGSFLSDTGEGRK